MQGSGSEGAQPQAAGTPPQVLGIPRTLTAPRTVGACCRAGGGGCLTTGSWHPLHAVSASPAGCWQLGRGGAVDSPKVVGRAPQWGVDQVGKPAGNHALTPPGGEVSADLVNATVADAGPGRWPGQGVGGGRSTGQRRLFLTGPCQFMARGARGWVPTLAPGGSWSCCWGGGGAELFCWNGGRSKEGELPSCGKTQRATTLGNHRGSG